MKISILFDFQEGSSQGGGNQFLMALRNVFKKRNLYEDDPAKSDIMIINSYHKFEKSIKFLMTQPKIIIIHRLGPIFHYHRGGLWKLYDKFVLQFANAFADGVVFQSNWSFHEALKLGFKETQPIAVIYNAPNKIFFNRNNKTFFNKNKKFRLIATSNSDNWKKGFKYFQFLDKNLDFSLYEMSFVGKSPVKFEHIQHINPQDSLKLAEILKTHDLYISPVQYEACSNAILEAISCGLPIVALNNSSNPEIVGNAGEIFNDETDLLGKIEKIKKNYDFYISMIPKRTIEDVADFYLKLAKKASIKPKNKKILSLILYAVYHSIVRIIVSLSDKFAYLARITKNDATPH